MHPSYPAEPLRERVYVDEFGGRHHPPPTPPDPARRGSAPRQQDPPEREQRRRRRANTYRAPPVPPSHLSSSSPSPPPHHRHRRPSHISPQNSVPDSRDPYNDYYAPRRRHSREEDYYSDSRHNRPPRDPYHDRPPRSKHHKPPREHREHGEIRERPQESERLTAHPSHERRASKWQQEAKNMFVEYAVPAIKAEGGKYLSKQIGNFIAKKA